MRRRPILPSVFACVALAVLIAGCGSSSKSSSSAGNQRPVTGQLVGTMLDGPVLSPQREPGPAAQLGGGGRGGEPAGADAVVPDATDQTRIADSSRLEGRCSLNEGGVPTNFQQLDRIVAAAAQRGLSILPVVWSTPAWAAQNPAVSGLATEIAGHLRRVPDRARQALRARRDFLVRASEPPSGTNPHVADLESSLTSPGTGRRSRSRRAS